MTQEDTENIELETPIDEPTEELETPVEEQTNDELAKAQAEAAKYRRLFEKSQKKPAPAEQVKAETPNSPLIDVDERVLKAQGMPDELLEKLKKVAALEGVSLIDAQNNDLFVAAKEKFEKEAKSKAASLGASRGSAKVQPKKDFTAVGLTKEEHMAMIKSLR